MKIFTDMNNEKTTRVENIRKVLEDERTLIVEYLGAMDNNGFNTQKEASRNETKEETVTAYSEFENMQAQISNFRERLTKIEHNLEKIGNGTYGRCDGCGKSIPAARLQALPYTSFCISCKSKK